MSSKEDHQVDDKGKLVPEDSYKLVYKLTPISDAALGSVLPGCSKGKDHNEKWTVSTTMMQTYLAMRGPGVDMEDPLLNWIGVQEVGKQQNGEPT